MDAIDLESYYADELKNTDLAQKIREQYLKRYPAPKYDPDTHPWLYDPLEPPKGWRYDPFYEMWIKT